ncbi:MAG: PD-(D/E)XK nuclease family protein [Desulfatiglandales bacterium]
MKSLSATGIRDFLQCVLKIVFRYDREIVSMKNDHMKIGIAVHDALEQFTRRMLAKKSFPDASDYEFAVSIFMNSATKLGLEKLSFYSDGKKIVTDYIDKYDPSEEIIDVEYRFKLETPEGIPIVGAIDKVVKINEDTIAIIDYKTSRTAMTSWQLQDDIQLSMYDLAASMIWPEYKNRILYLDYVRIDKQVSTYRTDEDRETFREFLVSMWTQFSKVEEEEVRGRINNLCGWCDYKIYCPTYEAFINSDSIALTPLTEMEDSEFLDHWTSVNDKKSALESRQRELKMIASERSMQGNDITDETRELYTTQAARTNYEIEEVVGIMPKEDLFTVLAVNKARLDRYVKDHPDLKTPLQKIAKVNYNAPVFKIKKVDPVEEIDVGNPVSGKNEGAA